ncbi:hypothetical protein, partial [Candidatus Ichthyocystis sparus]|uniref:hypothetical protein n=1 Tax=Candidatus Ichthyocystis sparus TaxID=1561004 RepID=UPI001F5F580C
FSQYSLQKLCKLVLGLSGVESESCVVREVFRDYEFQHLVHIWGRVLENLLEDQVQQSITAVCSAINKNVCLQENCSRTKKPCAAVL